jgi:hypothetical protein
MTRRPLLIAIAFAALTAPAQAGSPGPPRATVAKFAYSEVVVRAKVTAVAADTVTAPWHYDAKTKVPYLVATVTIETAFAGAEKLKEIKVGFEPPPKRDPKEGAPWRFRGGPQLKEGQEVLLFLCKHPSADFCVFPAMNSPVEIKGEQGKVELETAKRFAAVLADPMKGLKSDKAETRVEAATFLVIKHRLSGEFVSEVDEVAIPAEENRLIFAALLEADWKTRPRPFGWTDDPVPHPLAAFQQLNLTVKEGWVEPVIVAAPAGQPQPDYGLVMKDAFTKWRAGAGKDYVIKKLVPKQK